MIIVITVLLSLLAGWNGELAKDDEEVVEKPVGLFYAIIDSEGPVAVYPEGKCPRIWGLEDQKHDT